MLRSPDPARRYASRLGPRARAVVLVAFVVFRAAPVVAHPNGASRAEILFEQGRTQMAAGDATDACPKFEESYHLDPANGTLLALALCHEALGRWASAWTEFLGVVAASAHDGRADRAAVAREHIASVEPRVSKLTIEAPAETASIPGLNVECDGVHVDVTAGDVEIPIDPGTHLLQAAAPGRESWATSVHVGVHSEKARARIPLLGPMTPAPPPAVVQPPSRVVQVEGPPAPVSSTAAPALPAPPAPAATHTAPPAAVSPSMPAQRILSLVAVGVGVVAVGIGAGEGFHAIAENDEARSRCPSSPCANVTGLSHSQNATSAATAADILLGAGVVAIGAGAYLWFSAPHGHVSAAVGPRSAHLRFEW
jgi:hypothetical protein